jgi:hypothetical protein
MGNKSVKSFTLILGVLVIVSVFSDSLNSPVRNVNYFERHGLFFLIFLSFFPRLSLLFSSVPFGGIFWWLGFIFCPRILVSSLATVVYGHTNPVLVFLSWVIAIMGEIFEKNSLAGKRKFFFFSHRGPIKRDPKSSRDSIIEAEFTKKD